MSTSKCLFFSRENDYSIFAPMDLGYAESADVNLGDCMDETALMRAATWPVKNWGCQVFLPPKSQPGRTTTVGQFYGSWMFMVDTI